MTRQIVLRRVVLGASIGVLASFPLAVAWEHIALAIVLAAFGGALYRGSKAAHG